MRHPPVSLFAAVINVQLAFGKRLPAERFPILAAILEAKRRHTQAECFLRIKLKRIAQGLRMPTLELPLRRFLFPVKCQSAYSRLVKIFD